MRMQNLMQGIVLSLILSIPVLKCEGKEKSTDVNGAKIDRDAEMILYCSFDNTLQSTEGLKPEVKEFGGIKYEKGMKGQALKLTKESFVDLQAKGILPEQTGTIGFWIKPDWHELNAPTPPFRYHFLSKLPLPKTSEKDVSSFDVYYWNSPRAIVCSFIPGKKYGKIMNLDPAWRSENWNYIAITWQKGKSCKIYVNGNASPQLKGNEKNPIVGPADAIRLGWMTSAVGDVSLDGLIDELRIWNRKLSPEEIERRYEEDTVAAGLKKVVRVVRPDADKWLNLKTDFEAKGDGIADDTKALQDAIDCRQNVFMPVGVYRTTRMLYLRSYCNLKGSGGGLVEKKRWNDNGKTIIRYDGPEGGTAIQGCGATDMQLSNFTIDGNQKAGIGLKITNTYSIMSKISDITITRTLNDAIYLATMGVTTFERVYVIKNYGNGITMGSNPNKDSGAGAVNAVNFIGCVANNNGLSNKYDGMENVATGYGIGIPGFCTVINIIGCIIERNGGPGIYIGPNRKVSVKIKDCYTESNGASVTLKETEMYGKKGQYSKERKPLGIKPAILIESNDCNMSSIVIDNVYTNWRNSIWLKGYQECGEPVRFKNMYKVSVVYSEHGNWEFIDSNDMFIENGNIVKGPDAGIHVKRMAGSFLRTKKTASGHPGIRVKGGQRQVIPFSAKGITLYVNTDSGDEKNDGRTPKQAWKSFKKVSRLFNRSILDTPYTIEISGKKSIESMQLNNISGKGEFNIKLVDGATIKNPSFDNLLCGVNVFGVGGSTKLISAKIAHCPFITFSSLELSAPKNAVAASIQRKSGAAFLDCNFKGSNNSGTGLYCSGFSKTLLVGSGISGFASSQGVVCESGSSVDLEGSENKNGKSVKKFNLSVKPIAGGSGGSPVTNGGFAANDFSKTSKFQITLIRDDSQSTYKGKKKVKGNEKIDFKEQIFDFDKYKLNTKFEGKGWSIKSGSFIVRKNKAKSGVGNVLTSSSKISSMTVKENCTFDITENETNLILEADFYLEKILQGVHLIGIGQQKWNIGPRVGVSIDGHICLFGAKSRFVSKETLKAQKWYTLRLVMNLTANPIDDNFECSDASGSVYVKDLSQKGAAFKKVADLQNMSLTLRNSGGELVRPSKWSRIWIISAKPDEVEIDNVRLAILKGEK